MVALSQFAAPASEPVTLAEAKLQCSIDGSEHDAMLTWLIASARAAAETATNRALITQTWDQYHDHFPAGEMILLKAPLLSVGSITYIDTDGAAQTLSGSAYQVDTVSEPGRVTPAYGQVWPATRAQLNAVKIRMVCGYGAAAAVPADIKAWMLLCIGTLFENRETVVIGSGVAAEMPRGYVDQLVGAHRVYNFAAA